MAGDSLVVLKAKARRKAKNMLKLELQNHKLIAANDLHPRSGANAELDVASEIRRAKSTRLYKAIESPDTSANYANGQALESEKDKVMKLVREKYHEKNKDVIIQKLEKLFGKWVERGTPSNAVNMAAGLTKDAAKRRKAERKKGAAATKKAMMQEAKFNVATTKVAANDAAERSSRVKLAKSAKPSQVAKVAAMNAAVPAGEAKALRNAGVDVTKVMADHIKAPTVQMDKEASANNKAVKKAAAKQAIKIEKKLGNDTAMKKP